MDVRCLRYLFSELLVSNSYQNLYIDSNLCATYSDISKE